MRTQLRRHRAGIVVGVVVAAAITVTALLAGRAETADPLDPDNPGRSGTKALARVIAEHGVELRVARGADAFDDAPVDEDTTVVVTGTDALGPETVDRLLKHGRTARVVLVDPGAVLVDAVEAHAEPRSLRPEAPLPASCGQETYAGLHLEVDRATAYDAPGCFPATGRGTVLAAPDRYADRLLLWGAGEALTNEAVARGDNAAIALRLLGQDERLVWYVPDPADLDGSDGVGLGSLLPGWVGPGLWLALVAILALAWSRGRRLGPLAREPLPVVVRAAETAESLGRLYRRAGDRAHAAETLRRASLDRLAARLRLGGDRTVDQVARAAAQHSGRPVDEVARLLSAGPPPDDRALIALANDLAALEEEVRRP